MNHKGCKQIADITPNNIYQPSAETWPPHAQPHSALYIGDFNTHHEQWRCKSYDQIGEPSVNWTENHSSLLIFDAKVREFDAEI